MKYPSAFKQKLSPVLTTQDQPPSATPTAQLAFALVIADIAEVDPEADVSDIPELEEHPPLLFPFPPKNDEMNRTNLFHGHS